MASRRRDSAVDQRKRKQSGFHFRSTPASPCMEDLGDLHDALEEVEMEEVVQLGPHGKPPRMVTGADSHPCENAWRALDLKFPRVDSDSDWSEDDDTGTRRQVAQDSSWNKVVDGADDYDYNGQLIDGDKKQADCPGKDYSESDAEDIEREYMDRYCQQTGNYAELCDTILARKDDDTPFPPFPLKVLPPVTRLCLLDGYCYHSVYKTHDTSTTASTLGYRRPQEMLQFFSMCLSSSEPSYPISVYGIVAVRDDLDQRRNYVFKCLRYAAVCVGKQDSFVLPLCSPCRGMYVLSQALLEVDLWVKKEGDGSADKRILSAYAEIEVRADVDMMLCGRIPGGDDCNLDLAFKLLTRSIEAVIQVYAKVDYPHHVRFTASSTPYDDEIVLFDDKLFGNEKLLQHIVAVKKNANLDVFLRVDESQFQWTFQDECVGAVTSPDDSILEYGKFSVRVFFAPKNSK